MCQISHGIGHLDAPFQGALGGPFCGPDRESYLGRGSLRKTSICRGFVALHHGLKSGGSRLPPTTRMIVSRDELGGGQVLEDVSRSSKVHGPDQGTGKEEPKEGKEER